MADKTLPEVLDQEVCQMAVTLSSLEKIIDDMCEREPCVDGWSHKLDDIFYSLNNSRIKMKVANEK